MHEAHDALICIKEKNFIDEKNRLKFNDQHYLKSCDQVKNLYLDIPEALENNYNFHLDLILNQKSQNLFYRQ